MDLTQSKDKSSLYQHINELVSLVSTGVTQYFDCPKCGRFKKFGMTNKVQGVVYQCFSSSCGLKGMVSTSGIFVTKDKLSSILKGSTAVSTPFAVPDYFIDGFASVASLKMAERYDLLPAYTQKMYKTSYDPKLERQVFYYVDTNSNIVGATGRVLRSNQRPKQYIYPQSIKVPIKVGTNPIAAVCEDFFSCVRASNAGYTGISLSGTSVIADYLNYFRGYDKIIVALDKDATIKSLRAKKLLDFVCKDVVILPLQKDLKDMTNGEVQALLSSI